MTSRPIDLRPYTRIVATPREDITKQQFLAYERVRLAGKTNMLDLTAVQVLSGLKPEIIKGILQNWKALASKFNENWRTK